jgi:hypothetical protein
MASDRDPEMEVYARGDYARGARFVDTAMAIHDRPCAGGECDVDFGCRRHRLAAAVASRVERMRERVAR